MADTAKWDLCYEEVDDIGVMAWDGGPIEAASAEEAMEKFKAMPNSPYEFYPCWVEPAR